MKFSTVAVTVINEHACLIACWQRICALQKQMLECFSPAHARAPTAYTFVGLQAFSNACLLSPSMTKAHFMHVTPVLQLNTTYAYADVNAHIAAICTRSEKAELATMTRCH